MERTIECTCGHQHLSNFTNENDWLSIKAACCSVCTSDLPKDSDSIWDDPNFVAAAQTAHIPVIEAPACPDCGGEAGEYVENRCCACDSERRFNLSDIEWVQELCIKHMDRDPSVNIPVSMIDWVTWVSGGWDIHCDNGHNYRLSDGLYDEGQDAGPNARPLPSTGLTI